MGGILLASPGLQSYLPCTKPRTTQVYHPKDGTVHIGLGHPTSSSITKLEIDHRDAHRPVLWKHLLNESFLLEVCQVENHHISQ